MDIVDIVLAKALSGGGGGGSGLPTITRSETTIFAEQSVAFESWSTFYGADTSSSLTALTLGATYTVTWDGTDYTCVATSDGYDGVEIGNAAISMGGADTGEPFYIDVYIEGSEITTFSTEASHTVGITQVVQSPADGTVLSVYNGAWAASGAVLPEISGSPQTPADGAIMQVVNGAWQPTTLPSHLEVAISADEGGTYTCDKTYDEIVAAFSANTPIDATVYSNGNIAAKIAAYARGASFYFYSFTFSAPGLRIVQFTLNSSDVITMSYMDIGTWTS